MEGRIFQKSPTYGALGKQAQELEIYNSLRDIGEVIIDNRKVKVVLDEFSKLREISKEADNPTVF